MTTPLYKNFAVLTNRYGRRQLVLFGLDAIVLASGTKLFFFQDDIHPFFSLFRCATWFAFYNRRRNLHCYKQVKTTLVWAVRRRFLHAPNLLPAGIGSRLGRFVGQKNDKWLRLNPKRGFGLVQQPMTYAVLARD